jgi:hypothetical protein
MLDFEARDRFTSYLRESMSQSMLDDIKDVVKAAKNVLSLRFGRGSNDPKNLVFQQKQLLQVAEQYLQEKPWITYFAAVKHIIFLKSKGIEAATFGDFKDKEYVLEVEKYAERLATSAEAKIDDETQTCLQELIVLQQVEPLIPQSIATLKRIADMSPEKREDIREIILFPNRKRKSLLGQFFSPSRNEGTIIGSRFAIRAAAERLKQRPETWICSPAETIQYLEELQKRRPLLEQTYLVL